MTARPEHRLELVFMANRASPLRLWAQANSNWSAVVEYGEKTSLRAGAAAILTLLFLVLLLPEVALMLFLIGTMALFPLYLVGAIGCSRSAW